ncbi:hypothetical protein HYT25_00650 [Candidatus Pacearchaeota archaeon]|nr:hypothetical protein [Candidatus Pacearchaeota archaeon]
MMRTSYKALKDRSPRHDLLGKVFKDENDIFTFNQAFLDENSNGNLSEIHLWAKYAAALRKARKELLEKI